MEWEELYANIYEHTPTHIFLIKLFCMNDAVTFNVVTINNTMQN